MRLWKHLKDNRGFVFVDTYISLIICAAVTAVALTTFGAIAKEYTLIQTSNNIKRIIETDGIYNSAEQSKITSYLLNNNIKSATVSVQPRKDTYSLGEQFKVTVSQSAFLGGGAFKKVPLTLKASAEGMCEVYTK